MAETYLTKKEEKGSINISEEVIAGIVRSSVAEVEGFAGFISAAGAEIAEMIGLKAVSRGLKIKLADETITVDAVITVSYGFNIIKVAESVQSCIASALEIGTGFENSVINVHVAGIAF